MEKSLASLDWSLVQAFLAVAATGSLSAAARETGLSQPTLGRRIQRMERALGLDLFARRPRGLALSRAGRAILPAARAMAEAAARLELAGAGLDGRAEGRVRLTASRVVASFLLPPILTRLRRSAPGIDIDLVASDRSQNLLYRAADIALRMYRPTQLDVIARHLGDLELGIFAARSYLERRGRPTDPAALTGHDFIGYDRDRRIIEGMARLGLKVERDFFALRCDDQVAYWQLLRAGAGIGVGPVPAAADDPALVRLFPDLAIPPLPVWLTAHEAMRATPRIRRVWAALETGLGARLRTGILDPGAPPG